MPTESGAPQPRKPRTQTVMEVIRVEPLTAHMLRVVLGGAGFRQLDFKDGTDQYIKLLFADPALGLERPYDFESLREHLDINQMPVTRTYTIRHIDHQNEQIWVDFVIHGDRGVAGPWAASVQPGETISFFGPGAGYAPRPDADFHLLAGDEAALPAIAAALESMEADARGTAVIEVRDAQEELPLKAPEGVDVVWLHRGGDVSSQNGRLVPYLQDLQIPDGDVQVFIHGEREQMKAVRRVLVQDRGMERRGLSLSAYWALGRYEDQFQQEKRLPIGKIDPE